MTTIWRFPLKFQAVQTIEMPKDAQFLKCGRQSVYMLVDPEAPVEPRRFALVRVGQAFPKCGKTTMLGLLDRGPAFGLVELTGKVNQKALDEFTSTWIWNPNNVSKTTVVAAEELEEDEDETDEDN